MIDMEDEKQTMLNIQMSEEMIGDIIIALEEYYPENSGMGQVINVLKSKKEIAKKKKSMNKVIEYES